MERLAANEKWWIWLSSFSTYLVVVVFAISLTLLWVIWVFFNPAPSNTKGEVEIEIPAGFSFRQIAQLLYQNHLISNPTSFLWAGRILGMEKKVMAGTYLIPSGKSNVTVLRALSQAIPTHRRITIPEGYTIFQIASLLKRELKIDSVEFIKWCTDSTFAQELGVPASSLEGYLFPDTYFFNIQMSAPTIIIRMVNNFHHRVDSLIREEFRQSGFSLHQGITLASIIQGEMVYSKEARLISAVFHNRLKRRMPLEADPTIQYLIPEPPRRILLKDLEIDSPYNTYRYRGLPPGPINNPGLTAIKAAARPDSVDYLYFVSQGDGTHFFTSDYQEFLRAKMRLNDLRKAMKESGVAVSYE